MVRMRSQGVAGSRRSRAAISAVSAVVPTPLAAFTQSMSRDSPLLILAPRMSSARSTSASRIQGRGDSGCFSCREAAWRRPVTLKSGPAASNASDSVKRPAHSWSIQICSSSSAASRSFRTSEEAESKDAISTAKPKSCPRRDIRRSRIFAAPSAADAGSTSAAGPTSAAQTPCPAAAGRAMWVSRAAVSAPSSPARSLALRRTSCL